VIISTICSWFGLAKPSRTRGGAVGVIGESSARVGLPYLSGAASGAASTMDESRIAKSSRKFPFFLVVDGSFYSIEAPVKRDLLESAIVSLSDRRIFGVADCRNR
jgi:hypothetical protein